MTSPSAPRPAGPPAGRPGRFAALAMLLTGSAMSRGDRDRWRSARTMADLGELVIAWLHGEVVQTPGHCGPPDEETYPLIPYLTILNRGGFVTDNSQLAETGDWGTWATWVQGFATDQTLAEIRQAAAGTGLSVAACRGKSHECSRFRGRWGVPPCPRRAVTDFWATACPHAADVLWGTWWVHVEDPEPGRNDLMWPLLAKALGSQEGSHAPAAG